jgi:Zn-dependent oligopeptidase
MVRKSDKILFDELETWSRHKNALSINDFLKPKGIQINEFENLANSSKKFMKIWGQAESQAWENLINALFTKSLSRAKIAEYIKESNICQNRDPEEVMRELEGAQIKLELHLTAIGDTESLRKYGRIGCTTNQTEALMLCSLERGMITQKEYEEIMCPKHYLI